MRREIFGVVVRRETVRPLVRGDHAAGDVPLTRDGRSLVFFKASATSPGGLICEHDSRTEKLKLRAKGFTNAS